MTITQHQHQRQAQRRCVEHAPPAPPLSLVEVSAPRQEQPSASGEAKRPWPLRHLMVIGLAILAVVAMAIVIPLTVITAKAPSIAVGQPLVFSGNGGLRASVAVLSVAKSAHPNVTTISEPAKNGVYALADISISVNSGSYRFDPLYFTYQAANGRTYNAFDGNAWWAAYSSALTLSAGHSTHVKLTFDVPAAGRDIQFTYPLGHVVGQWNLAVTR